MLAIAVFGDLAEAGSEGQGFFSGPGFFVGMGGEDAGEEVGGVEEFGGGAEDGFAVGDGLGRLALFELTKDEAVAELGEGGLEGDRFFEVGEDACGAVGFEGDALAVLIEVGVFGMAGEGIVEDREGFLIVRGFGEGGREETENADVVGEKFARFAEWFEGFGGAGLLSEELSKKKIIVGLSEFIGFRGGLGEGGGKVVNGEVREGALDELLGGTLG